MVDPNDYIAPRNGFAMSFRDFVPHLMNVLDQLGMSLHARTNFIRLVFGVPLAQSFSTFSFEKSVTIFPRFLRTKTSPIGFSLPVGSQRQLTSPSPTIPASSLDCSSSSAAFPTTTSESLPVQARKRRMPSTGGRSSAGLRNLRTLRCSGSWRLLCLRLHRLSSSSLPVC